MNDAFQAFADSVFEAHGRGAFDEALALIDARSAEFPGREATLLYWRACLLAQSGQAAEAVRTLNDGIARGLWWSPDMLANDPDLAPIREDDGFQTVIAASRSRLAAAQASARMELTVSRPGVSRLAPPLVLALHQRFAHVPEFAERWSPVVADGAILAVPQSSQQLGMEHFGWDDGAIAERDVADAWARIVADEAFDAQRVVLGGMSQGGALAIRLALAGAPVPACGFIAVVPAIRDVDALMALAGPDVVRLRGWIVTGERDYGRDNAVALSERLVAAGAEVRVEVVPGLGHSFPADFFDRVSEAMRYVIGERG